jgi:hypothetical protein
MPSVHNTHKLGNFRFTTYVRVFQAEFGASLLNRGFPPGKAKARAAAAAFALPSVRRDHHVDETFLFFLKRIDENIFSRCGSTAAFAVTVKVAYC